LIEKIPLKNAKKSGQKRGVSLKIVPLPIPAAMAIPIQPIVYKRREGVNANKIPPSVSPANTYIKILKELNRSPSQPPTGRNNVAMTINPAVRKPHPLCPTRNERLKSSVSKS